MSRRTFVIFAVILSILLFPARAAYAEDFTARKPMTVILPRSLQEIEKEAFSDIAAETVVFPDGFLRIGEYAFEGVYSLRNIYLPETVVFIAKFAFPLTAGLTIHGIENSYAEKWAEIHHVKFKIDNIWNINPKIEQNLKNHVISNEQVRIIHPVKIITVHGYNEDAAASMRPQDRPELHPIDLRFP
ncbi:MAG: leucine-rich repeat protein [Oscillospiraceae bacterium]|nr:leucine-rich repeat protein [Oscillospiraceae bacterium]